MTSPTLFCFGLGYSARVFARRLAAKGWRIHGSCRTAGAAGTLGGMGFTAHIFDGTAPLDSAGRAALLRADAVLGSIPPNSDGRDPALVHHARDLAEGQSRWIGYLSTTGVYGDHDGAWVDETTPVSPATERGARRVAAERDWLALHDHHDRPVHVFRLAGIYGPGRNPLVSLRAGRARRIVKPGHVFSRIHVEDIARVLAASLERPAPGAIYNVCDDLPAPSPEVTDFAASLLGIDPPPAFPFEEAEMSTMARSFYADNKRVNNRRIREDLGVDLAYPDYRAGLAALHAAGEGSGP